MYTQIVKYLAIFILAGIAGMGGGYLAINGNNAGIFSKATKSNVTPAIPAQPFPGKGIQAIPAIPVQPGQKAQPVAPTISSVWADLMYSAGELPAITERSGVAATIFGSNFSSAFNTIKWDGKILAKDALAYFGDALRFLLPVTIPLGSEHKISVSTPFGTSNELTLKAVEYWDSPPWTCGVKPYTGPPGTAVDLCYFSPLTPFMPVSEKHYVSFAIPANLVKAGTIGMIAAFAPVELRGKVISGAASSIKLSFIVPKEVIYCPSFHPTFAEFAKNGHCTLAAPDTKITLPPGTYWIDEWYEYQYRYKRFYSFASPLGFFGGGPREGWYSYFTVTSQ